MKRALFDRSSLHEQEELEPVSIEIGELSSAAVDLFAAMCPDGDGALLESLTGTGAPSRYSYIVPEPERVVVRTLEETVNSGDDPFDMVRRATGNVDTDLAKLVGLPPFVGGAVAVLGYECAAVAEGMSVPSADPVGAPLVTVIVVRMVLAIDESTRRATAYGLVKVGDTAARVQMRGRLQALARRALELDAAASVSEVVQAAVTGVSRPRNEHQQFAAVNESEFGARVESIGEHIRQGDVVQAVIARRWSIDCAASDLEVYRSLRERNPSPHMAIVRAGGFSLVAASPELLLDARDGTASTSPIAGTRARGSSRAEDRANAAELRSDPKEQAEHLMLVDLARNDLNRVCVPGSVRVPRYMRTERFAHVMHLTSHVVGELQTDEVGALASVFPAGTVSGAPKLRAMEIIAEHEGEQRGPYAGAMVLAGADGSVEAAITLRSIIMVDGKAHVHAGAGIVAKSTPEGETAETASKASAALDAVLAADALAREGRRSAS